MKRGSTAIVDVALAVIFTLIVCEALGGLGACPPGSFEKLATPSEIESQGIFSNFLTFDVPVDTSTQNFLKMYYLHAYPYSYACWVMLQKLLYIKIVILLPLIAINTIINASAHI